MITDPARPDCPIPLEAIPLLEEALGRSLEGWDARPPRWCSPRIDVEGAEFSVEAVVRVVKQLRSLPHTAGKRWAGSPFDLTPGQIVWVIAPVFGWLGPDGLRIVRELFLAVPRKYGKTAIASRLGIVLLAGDGEAGAEVYAAAASKDQAGFVFAPAKQVAEKSKALRGRVKVLANLIRHPASGSFFRVVSSLGQLSHGANVHAALIDELHVHRDRTVVDALISGTASRAEPLIVVITTMDDGDDETIFGEKYLYALKLAAGEATNAAVHVVIWAAGAEDDPFAEETWIAANPNYPDTPTRSFLESEAAKARETPTALPTFMRLHLNVRRSDVGLVPFVTREQWDASAGMVVEERLKGRRAYGGLVAASASDLTAVCWLIDSPDRPGEWSVLWRWLVPEGTLEALDDRTEGRATAEWRPAGRLIVTEGDVIDVAEHTARIRADVKTFDVKEFAYDVNGAIGIVQPLMKDRAVDCVPTYANSPGAAVLELKRLVLGKALVHGGDPVARWQMQHVALRDTGGGVTKIDRRASRENVSGIAALEIALRRALVAGGKPEYGTPVSF